VTFVVRELGPAIEWFERVLGARHVERFDHHDEQGARFGAILQLGGFPGMIELRIASDGYPLRDGYDPVTFEVPDDDALESWLRHLDAADASHSPIKRRRTGKSIEITSPDGVVIRLFTAPRGGFADVAFQEQVIDR
jgi:catechol 2,3-dioxygenase-like lactoylglutathione lyase family enzyme